MLVKSLGVLFIALLLLASYRYFKNGYLLYAIGYIVFALIVLGVVVTLFIIG